MRTFQIHKFGRNTARAALALILGLGVASTATAGEVYSWTTDAGVRAFTNDQKRIPSRYKTAAKKQTVGSLKAYERYTPGPKSEDGEEASEAGGEGQAAE